MKKGEGVKEKGKSMKLVKERGLQRLFGRGEVRAKEEGGKTRAK